MRNKYLITFLAIVYLGGAIWTGTVFFKWDKKHENFDLIPSVHLPIIGLFWPCCVHVTVAFQYDLLQKEE
jgi:hypothetical protein